MHRSTLALPLLGLLALAACSDAPVASPGGPSAAVSGAGRDYVVLASSTTLPADLAARVARAGGTLTGTLDAAGVATATSSNPNFAAALTGNGIRSVVPDLVVQWQPPNEQALDVGEAVAEPGAAVVGGSDETFYNIQGAPKAIAADLAWAAGATGAGVRVAILDGAVHNTHIDLAANVDVAHSASFVPGQPYNADLGTFWHGTHVAGIVAAADNGIGTIGVAPAATIIGVKVLHGGSGQFSWVMNGIYYAATSIANGGAGADIINMSLGAAFNRQGRDAAELLTAMQRVVNYAYQQGTTIIASAGNSAFDLDHTGNLVTVPAMLAHVLRIAATGPLAFAYGATNYDRPASYTNYGQSVISFGAPGGDFAYPGTETCALPRIPSGTIVAPCWVFDMVISTSRGGATSISSYSWAAGTSMAAPAAAGVAALIIQRYGRIGPDAVTQKLEESADDLGKSGNDDYYGLGRVNAYRAWTQ